MQVSSSEILRQHLLSEGVLEPEGVHHEFVTGIHGRKLDFDSIKPESHLYNHWIDATVEYIYERFENLPEIIVGVADGANRLAIDTAERFDDVIGLESEKNEDKKIYLNAAASKIIRALRPKLVLITEDVSTTGSSSAQLAPQILGLGAEEVEVLTTWQRSERLGALEKIWVPYQAVIYDPISNYTPSECQENGHCADNWELIEYKKAA